MKERTWTIGSLPDCDIRVESSTVSGRHCRLTRRGGTFTIEDLLSTNGTFVTGERIQGPREVRRGEAITLGQSIPMPWPALWSITVGRLPDNDVVIPLDNVSGRHARLEREGGRVFLVDLGSTNGTALNDPLNKIGRAAIGPGDVVYLGTHRIAAAELLASLREEEADTSTDRQGTRLEMPAVAELNAQSSSGPGRGVPLRTAADWFVSFRSPRSWAIGVALSGVLLLLAAGANAVFRRGTEGKNDEKNLAAEARRGEARPGQSGEVPAAVSPPPMNTTSAAAATVQQPRTAKRGSSSPQAQVFDEERIGESQKGVYLICYRVSGKVLFLGYTAWAVSPEAIVCPAGMVKRIEQYRKEHKGSDECGVVCNPSHTLRIADYAPCDGDGTFLAIARIDAPAVSVAADRKESSAFKPEKGQTLAVIVARGSSVKGQPSDDPKRIATSVVALTVKQVHLDSQSAPDILICTPAEDVGLADAAPVFDGAGCVVGCVAPPQRGDAVDEVRVALLSRIPKLLQAIP